MPTALMMKSRRPKKWPSHRYEALTSAPNALVVHPICAHSSCSTLIHVTLISAPIPLGVQADAVDAGSMQDLEERYSVPLEQMAASSLSDEASSKAASTAAQRRRKKKKGGKARARGPVETDLTVDDDLVLLEATARENAAGVRSASVATVWTVDMKALDVDAELRRRFGSRVMRNAAREEAMGGRGRGRQPTIMLRRTLLVTPKTEWGRPRGLLTQQLEGRLPREADATAGEGAAMYRQDNPCWQRHLASLPTNPDPPKCGRCMPWSTHPNLSQPIPTLTNPYQPIAPHPTYLTQPHPAPHPYPIPSRPIPTSTDSPPPHPI